MINIVSADRDMLRYLLHHLRDLDRYEMQACEADLRHMQHEIMRRKVFAFCATDLHHLPIAAWGMLRWRQGVGAGFAFGTDRWGEALLPMVKQIRLFVLPFLLHNGFHRVEARALTHRQDVARFMSLIGACAEGVMRGYGVNGEDFTSYRWLANEHRSEGRSSGQTVLHAHTAH